VNVTLKKHEFPFMFRLRAFHLRYTPEVRNASAARSLPAMLEF